MSIKDRDDKNDKALYISNSVCVYQIQRQYRHDKNDQVLNTSTTSVYYNKCTTTTTTIKVLLLQ